MPASCCWGEPRIHLEVAVVAHSDYEVVVNSFCDLCHKPSVIHREGLSSCVLNFVEVQLEHSLDSYRRDNLLCVRFNNEAMG